MKSTLAITFFVLLVNLSFSQLTVVKKEGRSVMTKLGMGVKLNEGSSLMREYITINDTTCPIQLADVGLETSYSTSNYFFRSVGNLTAKAPIVAYEITHVIYNVFGEHMKSLSNTEVIDLDKQSIFVKYSSWNASENDVIQYLTCISYVSKVRTKDGKIWRYNFNELKEQLNKIEILLDDGHLPKKNIENDR